MIFTGRLAANLRLCKYRTGVVLACLLLSAATVPASALAQRAPAKPPVTWQGKLVKGSDSAPVLRTAEKDYRLSARTDWLLRTLQDERLAGCEIRVEGEREPGGNLKVNNFYILREGKVYKVRYFCEVCNIEALEPGDCVCCQAPTELQEIPVPEPGK
ncbi:MAG: hypothetical protein HYS33_00020 [Acidobacteria bacterium]|nr:hypothetical protein [Acidobacteriota bacterium]